MSLGPYPLLAAAAFYMVAATAQEQNRAVNPLAEFEGSKILDVNVRGAVRTSERAILNILGTARGEAFDSKTLGGDLHRLNSAGLFQYVRITEPVKVSGGVRLTVDVVEKAVISTMRVVGPRGNLPNELMNVIDSKIDGVYDIGQIHADKLAIERYCAKHGWLEAESEYRVDVIESHRQNWAGKEIESPDRVNVLFTVNEGLRSRVRDIKIQNVHAVEETQLAAQFKMQPRSILDLSLLQTDRNKIRNAYYYEHGYLDVSVDSPIFADSGERLINDDYREKLVDVVYAVAEGPQYLLGDVLFGDKSCFKEDDWKQVIHQKPGEPVIYFIRDPENKIGQEVKAVTVAEDFRRVLTRLGKLKLPVDDVQNLDIELRRVTTAARLKEHANLCDVVFKFADSAEKAKADDERHARHLKLFESISDADAARILRRIPDAVPQPPPVPVPPRRIPVIPPRPPKNVERDQF